MNQYDALYMYKLVDFGATNMKKEGLRGFGKNPKI